jgi:hypothetical protein
LNCFFSDDVVNSLVKSSVQYARQKGNVSFELSPDELRIFFAILFTSGYATLPSKRMYWETSPDVRNEAISNAMSRNRFEDILRNFHIANNDTLDPLDKFSKLRPLITDLNKRFLQHFPIQQQLSIDESMVPYFGGHSAKQFIRGKPIRFGYKMWCLASPLGYLVQMDPYQGAAKSPYGDIGMGGTVVLKLASCLLKGIHFHLYFDNLFTSINLLERLSIMEIGGTGTLRSNRLMGCPLSDLTKAKRGSFDYRFDRSSHVVVVRWKDSSPVTMASNCNGVMPIGKARRWSNVDKARVEVDQPLLVSTYNKYMGGVDRLDQNIAQYRIRIRNRKWYWPLVAYLLQVSMHNAWQLYRGLPTASQHPLSHLEFIRAVCNVYYAKYAKK